MTELLPSDVDKNIKLESIGDIKILELTPDQLKHKDFLGKVVLEVRFEYNFHDTNSI